MSKNLATIESEVLSFHEERLQAVEAGVSSCNVSLAECRIEINHLGNQLKSGVDSIVERLDMTNDQHSTLSKEMMRMSPRIEKLEESLRKTIARNSWIKKSIIGLLLAGLGGALAKVGEKVAEWIK